MNSSLDLLSTVLSSLMFASSVTAFSSSAIAQTTNTRNIKPYPAEAVEVFTKTCTEQGDRKVIPPETMRQICTCSIEEIQKTYKFEEFTQLGDALGQGKAAPSELNSIVQACVVQAMKK